ncbi:hypothetical protein K523DRAFT_383857 [Schizophyllum commune Tattone D]|nr:hypothetical protein K523DRAFT_383857 [Schizophyllum commune Tattone D]
MIREDKRPRETLYQVLNQARYAIISTVRYLSQFGVYNTVVFAMATVGYEGHLLSGWGTKPSIPAEKPSGKPMHLADTNCPKFTIAREVEAIRFVAFLQQLRDVHVLNMRQAVQSRQEVFLKEWENSRIERGTFSRRFHWSAHHQKNPQGKLPDTPMTRVRDQLNKVRKLDEKIGLVEAAAKSLTPGDGNEVTE